MNRMKRLLAATLMLWGTGALAQTPPATNEKNLIENPGFEHGNTAGWGFFGTKKDQTKTVIGPNVVHAGTYALQFAKDPQQEWGMMWQRLDGQVTWGDKIIASAWIKRTAQETGTPYVSIAVKDRTTYEMKGGVRGTAEESNTNWRKVTAEYTVPGVDELPDLNAVHIEINIGVEGSQDPNDILVDDIEVVKKS
jgi:hypothetical protein